MLQVTSVNIEARKHLDQVAAFLKTNQPDVLCLQEVCEVDVPTFAAIVGGEAVFVPMFCTSDHVEGIALISRYPFVAESIQYAGAREDMLPFRDTTTCETKFVSQRFMLLSATIKMDATEYVIATTHSPVTKDGTVTDFQVTTINNLIHHLLRLENFVLLGDLNAPRGERSFALLAERFKDNIPTVYKSSLDPVLHRAAPLTKMVDCCFSTPLYTAEQVQLICGVSDHCAVTAKIGKENR